LDDQDLLRLADQCVKCGLCLPHCPTFRLAHHEGDSPRGRIALIQGLIGGQLQDNARLAAHLEGCLECRACEVVCPSLVQFGTLMDAARAARVAQLPPPVRWRRRLRLDLLASTALLPWLAMAAMAYRRLRIPALADALGLLRQPHLRVLSGLAGRLRWPGSSRGPVAGATARTGTGERQAVALFRGCVARALEPAVLQAARRVLARLGVSTVLPDGQVCCGAMHRHNGFPAQADELLRKNRAVFGERPVIASASACAAELQPALAARELCRALLETPWPDGLEPTPLRGKVAVHEPCSHRNQLRDNQAVYALLAKIPGLEVLPLPGNESCCGAAGTYLLDQPETALTLVRAKVEGLATLKPRWLATTNTGCAAHIGAAAAAAGLDIEVVHPVQLLDQALARRP
jgi:glycolate oxidase iron-sulfur subunit